MSISKPNRYHGEIVAGSLLVPESRKIAGLLFDKVSDAGWYHAIIEENILQKKSPATAKRQAKLIRKRLSLMSPELWSLVQDGSSEIAVQALLAATIKHSRLVGDFMDGICRDHRLIYNPKLNKSDWRTYIESCTQVEPAIALWSESTNNKLRQVVFRILAESGYLDNTRSLKLQKVHLAPEVMNYLKQNQEKYVLRCMEITS